MSSLNTAAVPGKEKIGLVEKLAYGGGDLGCNLILVLVGSYAAFFYTDALGLSAGIIGSIMLASRIFDGISDIFMGFIMDKTKSRHGKARPWILWLALPIAVATVLIFLVPNTGDLGKYIYIAITYNLVSTFLYTAINIPYGALTALMSRDQDQRLVINIFRMMMASIGGLAISALTLPFVNALGGSGLQRSWVIASMVYGFLAMALLFFCFGKTKERVKVEPTKNRGEKVSFVRSLRLMLKNDCWVLMALLWIIMSLGLTISMSMGTYYAKYVLLDENIGGYLAALSTLPALLLMPLVAPVVRKTGKRNIAILGCTISLAGQLLMLLNPAHVGWLMFCSFFRGIGYGPIAGTIFALIADTIEYGQWKTGIRIEGMLYSSTTFGAKVASGLGGAIAMGVIGAAGYHGLAAVQTSAALAAIKGMYLYAAIPSLALSPLLLLFYRLDKIYPQVMADLKAREEDHR
jgi:GPH family glycoside/pentoside/hexuronide:cation symporter